VNKREGDILGLELTLSSLGLAASEHNVNGQLPPLCEGILKNVMNVPGVSYQRHAHVDIAAITALWYQVNRDMFDGRDVSNVTCHAKTQQSWVYSSPEPWSLLSPTFACSVFQFASCIEGCHLQELSGWRPDTSHNISVNAER